MKFEFLFPDIGEGIHEGVLMKWLVKEGDNINEGDSLAEVETDKVTTEIPSPRTGKVLNLKFGEGDTINVGQGFITIDVEGEESSEAAEATIAEVVEEETAGVVGEVIATSEVIPPSTEEFVLSAEPSKGKKVLATPVARKMAKDLGVDISTIKGTGPNGRVMKEDIQKAKAQVSIATPQVPPTSKPSPISASTVSEIQGNEERIPLTRIRKTISERMSQSRFTIPHTTHMDEIDISNLDEFRRKYKDILMEEDIKLTYLPFIIKATIMVLKEYPVFNASLDNENDELIFKYYYNIGIATDTDRGLMVPVVKDADKLSIIELANAIEDVSNRAKDNKSQLHELRGGTFSVTNYGSIGGHFAIPIINYPESAILGLGRIVKKPIVKDDEIVIARVLPVSLSYDHRIIDGASGAHFINLLRKLLSEPEILLLKA